MDDNTSQKAPQGAPQFPKQLDPMPQTDGTTSPTALSEIPPVPVLQAAPQSQPVVSQHKYSTGEILGGLLALSILLSLIIPGTTVLFSPVLFFAVMAATGVFKKSEKQQSTSHRALVILLKVIIGVVATMFVLYAGLMLLLFVAFSSGGGF